MWKKILIGIVGVIVLAITLVMFATSGMTDTAEIFFEKVKSNQYGEAYSYLSEDFKKSTNKEQLVAFMKQTGLDQYQHASWGNRSFEGKRGEIEGTIETASGSAIAITMKFIKLDDGSWRIYNIYKPASGIETDDKVILPSSSELITLVKSSILRFSLALNKKDMSDFHAYVSSAFQKDVSVTQMNQAFQSFMDMGIDFTALDKMKSVFDPKPILKDNVLEINGYYSTTPNKFYYALGYTKEDGEWKLLRINVEIK